LVEGNPISVDLYIAVQFIFTTAFLQDKLLRRTTFFTINLN
jgi:hypothetical protein